MLGPVSPGPASAFRYAPGVLSVNAYHVASCPLPIGYDDPAGRIMFNSFVLVAFDCGLFVRGCTGLGNRAPCFFNGCLLPMIIAVM